MDNLINVLGIIGSVAIAIFVIYLNTAWLTKQQKKRDDRNFQIRMRNWEKQKKKSQNLPD